jgi:transcriptional regulator with XRE-family HTH domain
MKLKRTEKEIAFARTQGRKLYDIRKARKLSRRQLAKACGLNPAMIYRIEMGDTTATAFVLDAVADALGATADDLFPRPCRMVPISMAATFGESRAYA